MRRPSAAAAVTFVAVAGAALFVFLQLQPHLVFADTTAAGGDMGAHVWGPAYLRDHVLPHGRITGWTPDWYAGFPAYHFYFPLPNLLVVLLDVALPYGVAFKLVTILGLVGLPVVAWAFGRLTRLPFPIPAMLAIVTVVFIFDRFHTIWGGNAAATLAGEFSFSIALATALLFLGFLHRALETGRGRAPAAALLAITALCHLLPAAFAVGGAVVMLALRRPDRARWRLVLTVGIVGFAVAAIWFVPFLARLHYSNDMGWERTQEYVKNLFPWLRTDDAAKGNAGHLKVSMLLAVVGLGFGFAKRRRATIALGAIALASAAAFVLVPNGAIWNARVLPFWYLTTYLLAAVAVGEMALLFGEVLIEAFRDRRAAGDDDVDGLDEDEDEVAAPVTYAPFVVPEPVAVPNVAALVAPVAALLAVIVGVGIPLGVFASGRINLPGPLSIPVPKRTAGSTSFVPAWATWNYSGYERKPDYPEYREVVQTMARLGRDNGCGRAMWEYEPELNRFGTPMALMLLPHWTDGCIGSMEGLFFESSASVPYHFLNQSELSKTPSRAMRDLPYRNLDVRAGIEHLQLMGVRYYLAISPDAQAQAAGNPNLKLLATTTSRKVTYGTTIEDRFWQVYEVEDAPIVAPLRNRPVVVESGAASRKGWLGLAVDWYQDSTRWDVPLAAGGPADWPRVADPAAAKAQPTSRQAVRAAKVSDIVVKDDRITFHVDRPGVPVLVRMSYFPNWKARGAEGPWRVTPNFMVVIPTAHEVTLRYGWTGVDVLGLLLTLVGVAAVVGLAKARPAVLPAARPRRPEPEPEFVDPFAPPAEAAAADRNGRDDRDAVVSTPDR